MMIKKTRHELISHHMQLDFIRADTKEKQMILFDLMCSLDASLGIEPLRTYISDLVRSNTISKGFKWIGYVEGNECKIKKLDRKYN